MSVYRTVARFGMDTGNPADDIVNVMHWMDIDDVTEADSSADRDAIRTRLQTFYNAFDEYLSPRLSGAWSVAFYSMFDASPRVPIVEYAMTGLTLSGTASSLPAELSSCLSFRAALGSGINMARRRGRIFLPPLNTDALENTNNATRPASAFRTAVLAASDDLARDATETTPSLCIYSPTTDATEVLGASVFPAVHAWMDDAFDVIRKRGAPPTTRTEQDLTV